MNVVSMRGLTLVLSALLIGVVAGCASDRKTEYISEGSKEASKRSLEVPPDLVVPGRDTRFQVPGDARKLSTSASDNAKLVAATQSAPAATPDKLGGMHIDRAGTERWLVVPGTPETVWPRVRKFWEDLGFTIKTDSTQLYIMETDWAEKREKSDGVLSNVPIIRSLVSNLERDKFRSRLETGLAPGTVEIYISHRALEEADLSRTGPTPTNGWVTKPGDPGLEMEMLRRLMVSLGASDELATAAVKDVGNVHDKAQLIGTAEGNWQLNVDGSGESVWRQVGLALDRVGMVVEDRDRSKGIYFVRYITDADLGKPKEGSWYSWMLFWKSEDKKPDTDLFRIVVKTEAQSTQVIVLDHAGARATAESSKRILNLLYNELK